MRKVAFWMFVVAASAWASSGCLVIDDFTTGKYRVRIDTPNTSNYEFYGASDQKADPKRAQTGSMLGGVRVTDFRTVADPFGQIAELSVAKGGPLVVSNGARGFFRLDLIYGQDTNFGNAPLGYFPTGCDRFRVTFDSNSRRLSFGIVVFQGPGFTNAGGAFDAVDDNPSGIPFCVDVPFASFPPGQAFTTNGINLIGVLFQSGSAIGANDFAVTKFETVDAATAAANPCAQVVPPRP